MKQPAKGRSTRSLATPSRPWAKLAWLVPGIAACLLYLPSLGFGLVWDDPILVEDQLPAFGGLRDAFFPPSDIPQWGYSYYRPLVTASFLAEQALFGSLTAKAMHATVVVLHSGCSVLVMILAGLALRDSPYQRWGALAAGLLFAVHPIHSESVAWISGRSDVLAALFLFSALALAISYRDSRSNLSLVASSLAFLLAALSKEVAIAAVVLIPAWILWVPKPSTHGNSKDSAHKSWSLKSQMPLAIAYGLALALYVTLRWAAATQTESLPTLTESLPFRLLSALGYYTLKILVPWPPSALVMKLPGPAIVLSALSLLLVLTWWCVQRLRRGDSIWLLGLLTILLGVSPSLPVAISTLAEAPVAERYLYIPSLGLAILFGALCARGRSIVKATRWMIAATVLVLVSMTLASSNRIAVWRTDLTLWSSTVAREPDSGLAWGELGKAYLDRGVDFDKALEAFKNSVDRTNDSFGRATSLNSMAVIYSRQGRAEAAEDAWREAIRLNPDYSTAHFNLGNYYARRVDQQARFGVQDISTLDQARRLIARAIELNPRYSKAALRLVWCDVQKTLFLAARRVPLASSALHDAERSHTLLENSGPTSGELRESRRLLSQARQAIESAN